MAIHQKAKSSNNYGKVGTVTVLGPVTNATTATYSHAHMNMSATYNQRMGGLDNRLQTRFDEVTYFTFSGPSGA